MSRSLLFFLYSVHKGLENSGKRCYSKGAWFAPVLKGALRMAVSISEGIRWLNRMVWGFPALVLILGVGMMYTLRTRFFQGRYLGHALRSVGQTLRRPAESGVSPFQAVCTALAATVGTGNIAGVAGAIALGGPGAVFWMWVSAFLGMILKYAEVVLAVRYREPSPDGTYLGGPMYYIRAGLSPRWRFLAPVYSIFGLIAAFGIGNATQVSTAVVSINEALPFFGLSGSVGSNWFFGLLMGLGVALVVLGGAKRIGAVAEYLIPVVCLGYIVLSLGALLHHRAALPGALAQILSGAFSPRACTGGVVGSAFLALRIGVARGIFTNEAGMGTASIAHANANVNHPAQQGLFGIFEVFADTIVICTMTALVILTAPVSIPYGTACGAELTVRAFATVYGPCISVFLAISMVLLAFATILGWGLYGNRCAEFLFGPKVQKPFSLLHALTTVLGAVVTPALLWELAEAVNGLMALPNLVALLALSPEVIRLTANYSHKRL